MQTKELKTTLTLKLTIRTDTKEWSVDQRIRKFLSTMSSYDCEVNDDCEYEIVADQCGDNTVIRHNAMNGKSFTFRDIDGFFEKVFELEPSCFMSVLRDIAHIESVKSNTEETVETE